MPPRRPLLERFWEKVQISDGCWLWTGSCDRKGYGTIGTGVGHNITRAHRLSYAWAYGDPGNEGVFHHCDTPPCVRPTHLFTGSQLDNLRDMEAKGRSRRGGRQGPKLTTEKVLLIRERGQAESRVALAREFGVSTTMIRLILTNKTWRNL